MRHHHLHTHRAFTIVFCLAGSILLSACGVPREQLVTAPLVFQRGFEAGDAPDAYDPEVAVFFATTREPDPDEPSTYGNVPSESVRFGLATLRINGPKGEPLTADIVRDATINPDRDIQPGFDLVNVETHGQIAHAGHDDWTITDPTGSLIAPLREAVAASQTRDLLVFVDGTKGNFYRSSALAAEARHMLGRSMPVLTFVWPSHQQIYSYVWGSDEQRADAAGYPFAAVMDYLTKHSGAERIHILSYSAGGRVTSIGLSHLRERHASETDDQAHRRLGLGTVVFAAADEPIDRFLNEVPDIHDIADHIVVTMSQRDHALVLSEFLKGEGQRLGREYWSGPTEAELQMLRELPHVEFVDVSYGRQSRGFKVKGHGYWYRQPWIVSDVIMALRTNRPGSERGLIEEILPHVYGMTAEYPERLEEAATSALPRQPGKDIQTTRSSN